MNNMFDFTSCLSPYFIRNFILDCVVLCLTLLEKENVEEKFKLRVFRIYYTEYR